MLTNQWDENVTSVSLWGRFFNTTSHADIITFLKYCIKGVTRNPLVSVFNVLINVLSDVLPAQFHQYSSYSERQLEMPSAVSRKELLNFSSPWKTQLKNVLRKCQWKQSFSFCCLRLYSWITAVRMGSWLQVTPASASPYLASFRYKKILDPNKTR